MKKRTFVSIALAVALVLSLAAPAFAQSMSYQAGLEMDGTIDREMQAGHKCNTGAEMKQTITGTGTLTKATGIAMVQGKLSVSDTNDFVTAADAVRNLTVTSVIELCAPPKMTYETGGFEGPVQHVGGWYGFDDMPRFWFNVWDGVGSPQDADAVLQMLYQLGAVALGFADAGDPLALMYPGGGELGDYERLTKQIWAVQVEANPGFSGNLHQRFEAAYGPYEGTNLLALAEEPELQLSDRWTWGEDDDGIFAEYGDDYVGNYFSIGQMARTSDGVVKRFIDISSPFSHGYLMEDMTVTGMAEVQERFTMGNLGSGDSVPGDWWDLF